MNNKVYCSKLYKTIRIVPPNPSPVAQPEAMPHVVAQRAAPSKGVFHQCPLIFGLAILSVFQYLTLALVFIETYLLSQITIVFTQEISLRIGFCGNCQRIRVLSPVCNTCPRKPCQRRNAVDHYRLEFAESQILCVRLFLLFCLYMKSPILCFPRWLDKQKDKLDCRTRRKRTMGLH